MECSSLRSRVREAVRVPVHQAGRGDSGCSAPGIGQEHTAPAGAAVLKEQGWNLIGGGQADSPPAQGPPADQGQGAEQPRELAQTWASEWVRRAQSSLWELAQTPGRASG
ncbi:hypothetical protein CYMTET_19985 [Cymbomonas tetramitiformis]|uniref:Uncharacterized protein n=1 Tax=Cymbomonas tetramitiformis TaxID=36881 RepID=A0AAE0L4C0_9CHLO|nr:hypothetical protein CYMTET_19985 [Cymbomonas tetramitiformis]